MVNQSIPLGADSEIREAPLRSADKSLYGSGARYWIPRLLTVAAIVIGGALAYTLAAVELVDGSTLTLKEVSNKFTFKGDGWVLTLSWFGAIVAILAALLLPHSERIVHCLGVTFGALLAMAFPLFTHRNLTLVDEDASKLGPGLIGALICFAIAAVIPWITLFINREQRLLGNDYAKWLFVLPAVAWLLLLTAFPLAYAITISRYQFRNGLVSRFVGWENYRRLFEREWIWTPIWNGLIAAAIAAGIVFAIVMIAGWFDDHSFTRDNAHKAISLFAIFCIPVFIFVALPGLLRDPVDNAFEITTFFVVIAVTIEMILGFGLALLMNRELRGRGIYRAVILLPIFAAPVGIGYLGRTIFYEEGGPVNALIRSLGFAGVPWLSNPFWSKISTIIADVWLWTPFVFVIALAGLQGLPIDIQEAAQVDGARSWQSFRTITLPLMAPILWLILFLRTIDAFKVFDIAASMTVGGPGRATEYYSYLTYRTARKNFNYGDAAAQSFLLLLIVSILITVLWGRIRGVYEEER
ncbi:MAG: sugar ABC transporter permease [Thermomicrobiales bacterium]